MPKNANIPSPIASQRACQRLWMAVISTYRGLACGEVRTADGTAVEVAEAWVNRQTFVELVKDALHRLMDPKGNNPDLDPAIDMGLIASFIGHLCRKGFAAINGAVLVFKRLKDSHEADHAIPAFAC